jgi:hypothetical protein
MTPGSSRDDFDDDLINAEFESMVEGLSLDESTDSTYLDELEKFEDENKFTPPNPKPKSFFEQLRDARRSFTRWKNNPNSTNPEDGAAL